MATRAYLIKSRPSVNPTFSFNNQDIVDFLSKKTCFMNESESPCISVSRAKELLETLKDKLTPEEKKNFLKDIKYAEKESEDCLYYKLY